MKPRPEIIHFNAPVREVRLLDRATARADRESRWQHELQASHERGRLDGEGALGAQLMQQRAELMEIHTGTLAALQSVIPQLRRDSERALIQLSLEVARRLVGDLPIDEALVESVVRDALSQVEGTTDITVLLHPEDLELMRRANSPLLRARENGGQVQLQESADVTRGGCIVRTNFGLIDSRRETKFQLLQKALAT